MTTRDDELVDMVARHIVAKISALGIDYWSAGVIENERYGDDQQTTDAFRFIASLSISALRAAGVIPAEGDVVIERGRWDRVSRIVVTQGALNMMENEECDHGDLYTQEERDMIWDAHRDAWDALQLNDLDEIPAAPTGEGDK